MYKQLNFTSRQNYLNDLADEYGAVVFDLADVLGEEEDFDWLVTSLENFSAENLLSEYFISRGKRYDYLVFDKISQVIICRSDDYYKLHKKYKEQRYDIWMRNISYLAWNS